MQIKEPKSTFFAVLSVFIVFLLCISFMRLSVIISNPSVLYDLDSCLNIKINDTDYGKQKLSKFVFPSLKAGSVVTVSTVVPDICKVEYPELQMEISDAAVKVFNDGNCVYEQYMDRFSERDFIGSGVLSVPLSDFKSGDVIDIEFFVNEKNAFMQLKPFQVIPASKKFSCYIKDNLFVFICIAFMFVLGLVGSVLCFSFWIYKRKAIELLTLAQLLLWASVYLICDHGFVQYFSLDFAVNTTVKIIALIIALFSILTLYYFCFGQNNNNQKILNIFIKCLLGVTAVLLILHFTGICHFSRQMVIFRILIGLIAFYGLFNAGYILYKEPFEKCISAVGILLLLIFFSFDYFCFFIFYVVVGTSAFIHNIWFAVGIVCLFVCILIDFIMQLVKSVSKDFDNIVDENSKSIDFLTDVLNRDALMQKFSEIEKLKKNYVLITLDIVNTADVSTKAGAELFNETVVFFANVINHVFSIVGDIGRISNAGFVILSSEITERRLQQLLLVFQDIINADSSKFDNNVSVLIGSAFSSEIQDENCRALYSLAHGRRAVFLYNKKINTKK